MRSILSGFVMLVVILIAGPATAEAPQSFEEDMERIDEALRSNPGRVLPSTLDACRQQYGYASKLYYMGMEARARRTLDFCFEALKIPREATVKEIAAISQEQLKQAADKEYEKAMALEPDLDHGLALYRECAACHQPEGWGLESGTVPQIAGQHGTVIIRQLADFRSGNRDSVVMIPYATAEAIGGPQAMADVAGYVASLEITTDNGKGPGDDLATGRKLYGQYCVQCHGESGEGSDDELVPRIQAQHYRYLVRQFEWIRDGKRRNADPDMVAQVQGFNDQEISALMDYVSRLEPPEELQAPPGWKNPDFE